MRFLCTTNPISDWHRNIGDGFKHCLLYSSSRQSRFLEPDSESHTVVARVVPSCSFWVLGAADLVIMAVGDSAPLFLTSSPRDVGGLLDELCRCNRTLLSICAFPSRVRGNGVNPPPYSRDVTLPSVPHASLNSRDVICALPKGFRNKRSRKSQNSSGGEMVVTANQIRGLPPA